MSGTTKANRASEYETIFVLRPDVDPDAAEKLQNRLTDIISREKGTLVKVESWGRRKLAYPVAKQRRGVYIYLNYVGQGGLVAELERNLRIADFCLKFLTVKLRDRVDVSKIQIDPEQLKLARIEAATDDDDKESRERSLGLVDPPVETRMKAEEEAPEGDEAAEA
jgi:small subunit ribosomal protein S6